MTILRIRGYLTHNEDCLSAKYANAPRAPLHPNVFEHCLRLLNVGAPLTEVKTRNREMVERLTYRDMPKTDEARIHSKYRWLLHDSDTRALYRLFNRQQGIDTRTAAHVNVHEWLDPTSSKYNKQLAEAVFHYSARVEKGSRFEVCISSQEMKEAAWKYGHRKQIIMDGTFGVCDKKLLLFIIMGIDELNSGVPLAFLLFSAPSGNNQTSSGYDYTILQRLLQNWVDTLGQKNGENFGPATCITDTDIKERKALSLVFYGIILLICRFHIRQSWKNNRIKRLGGDTPLHQDLTARARNTELALLETESFDMARNIVGAEVTTLRRLMESRPNDTATIGKAIEHMEEYFLKYWLGTEALWQSWSKQGRILASEKMQCPIEQIVTTTNHLESFNNVLKGKHLQRWKHGGRRLRVDVLIWILVHKITPAIFSQRRAEAEELHILEERWRRLPGGQEIVEKKRTQARLLRERGRKQNDSVGTPALFYLMSDKARDEAAADILAQKQISSPEFIPNESSYLFTCYSTQALEVNDLPTVYGIELRLSGKATCNCLDFMNRGGACKHLRAALLQLDHLRKTRLPTLPLVYVPRDESDALMREHNSIQKEGSPIQPGQVERAVSSAMDTLICTNDPYLTTDGLDLAAIDSPTQLQNHTPEITHNISASSEHSDASSVHDLNEDKQFQARTGVDDQTVARVLNDMESIVPKLEELSALVQEVQINEIFHARLTSCQQRLQATASQLCGTLVEADKGYVQSINGPFDQPPSTSTSTSLFPFSDISLKRTVDLLPPSPEKTQKRKKSYSHH